MPGPTQAEAAAFGMTLDEAEGAAQQRVLPDNLLVTNVFITMMTQWRSSGFGTSGLDYNVFPLAAQVNKIPKRRWAAVLEDLRVMEESALKTMEALAERKRRWS